jgi:hypothetical protein
MPRPIGRDQTLLGEILTQPAVAGHQRAEANDLPVPAGDELLVAGEFRPAKQAHA